MPNLIKDRSILSLMLVTLAFTVRFFNQKLRYYFDCVVCRFSRGTWYGTKPFKRLVPCDLCIMELTLKGVLYTRLARKGFLMSGSRAPPPPPPAHWPDDYAILMSPNKGQTAFHSCHWRGDMVVRRCKVLAIRGVGTCASVHNLVGSRWFTVENDFSQTN